MTPQEKACGIILLIAWAIFSVYTVFYGPYWLRAIFSPSIW